MGLVYEAQEVELGRHVALKLMPELFSVDQQLLDLFDAECHSLARITHPRVVPVYRTGWQDDSPYLVMEFLPRGSLGEHLERIGGVAARKRAASDLPCHVEGDTYVDTCIRIALQVLDGLAAVHQQGLVHRDLKPDNLMLAANGDIKIGDFGLAKDIATSSERSSRGRRRGTPAYMSPEQAAGNFMGLDHRSDLFSVGIILYELLAGRRPFDRESEEELTRDIVLTKPTSIRKLNRVVSRDLARVIDRALEKDANHRYSDARSFAADLERCLRGEPIVIGKPTLHDRVRRLVAAHSNANSTSLLVTLMGVSCLVLLIVSRGTIGKNTYGIAVICMVALASAGHALALVALMRRRTQKRAAVIALCIHGLIWLFFAIVTYKLITRSPSPEPPNSRAELLQAIDRLEGILAADRSSNPGYLVSYYLLIGDCEGAARALDHVVVDPAASEGDLLLLNHFNAVILLEAGSPREALQAIESWKGRLTGETISPQDRVALVDAKDFIGRVEPLVLHVLGRDQAALEAATGRESCVELRAELAALMRAPDALDLPVASKASRFIRQSRAERPSARLSLHELDVDELSEQLAALRYPWFEGDFYAEPLQWDGWAEVIERLEMRFDSELGGCPASLLPRASRLLWLAGDVVRAERYALAALDRPSVFDSLRVQAEAYETLARVALARGACDEAISQAERALALCPSLDDLPRLQGVLSDAYRASGRMEDLERLAALVGPLTRAQLASMPTDDEATER